MNAGETKTPSVGSCAENSARQCRSGRRGKLLIFERPADVGRLRARRLARRGRLLIAGSKPKERRLISKYSPPNWSMMVGARVAAFSDGRIVQGTILGVKDKPSRPAAFARRGFCGCWLLLDDGRKVVGNELRPICSDEGPG